MSTVPLERYPVFERKTPQDNNGLIIVVIIIVIFVIIGAIIVYAVFHPINSLGSGLCETSLCAVNITTGVKRCPANSSDSITYNIALEECTSQNYCQGKKTPCAVLQNGSLNCTGVCGSGNEGCRCVKSPTQIK